MLIIDKKALYIKQEEWEKYTIKNFKELVEIFKLKK